ncbi:MAG: HEAT resistant agglutinin 1 protein [Hoeflea sp. BRH_c9]|nr:MAG: HEAT resistant agglutinin 1 protein [Hoeflea sp. BRH_c9]
MRKILLAGAAMVFAGVGSAAAADILPAPIYDAPIYEAPVSQPVAAAGGWYLRGDAGYAWNKIKDPGFFQGSNANYVGFATSELRSSYSVGVGVGYQIRRYLRTDLTLDYFSKADFRGSTTGICPGGGACRSSDTSKVGGLSLLANAYVDFGTFGRFTPYAGAGIGGTYVSWDSLAGTSVSCPGGIPCAPDVTYPGAKSWRFTYALMAGASIDVTCNLKADVGYRYRRISGGKMFGYALGVGPGYEDGMSSHEVRGGLRYSLGGCPQQEVYIEPAPIMPAVYK